MAKKPKTEIRPLENLVETGHVTQSADNSGPKERPAHWFKPGQSGNPAGKPKGARHALTEDFVKALYADFKQHGPGAIVTVREEDPGKYLDIVCKLVPKDIDVNVNASDAFVKIWEAVAAGAFHGVLEGETDVSRGETDTGRPN